MASKNSSSSMQSDAYFAEMLKIMRAQGRKDNPITLQLGIMQSADSVKIGDLVLLAEDLYIANHLINGLIQGDIVAVQKLHDTNSYVILAKVVRA